MLTLRNVSDPHVSDIIPIGPPDADGAYSTIRLLADGKVLMNQDNQWVLAWYRDGAWEDMQWDDIGGPTGWIFDQDELYDAPLEDE